VLVETVVVTYSFISITDYHNGLTDPDGQCLLVTVYLILVAYIYSPVRRRCGSCLSALLVPPLALTPCHPLLQPPSSSSGAGTPAATPRSSLERTESSRSIGKEEGAEFSIELAWLLSETAYEAYYDRASDRLLLLLTLLGAPAPAPGRS